MPLTPRSDRNSPPWIMCVLLAALVIATFRPAISTGFVRFDDGDYVTHNSHVLQGISLPGVRWALTTTDAANWHPLTWLSLMLDAQFFGAQPAGYHFTNIFLHALAAVALFMFLSEALNSWRRALLIAAIFAIHPLRVESVAWIAERKDVLAGLFGFAAMLAYVRYVRRPAWWRYVLTLLALALSLCAKPTFVTLPFLLLLLDAWPLGRLRGNASVGRLVLEKIPLLVLSAASCAITVFAQQRGGAMSDMTAVPLPARLANTAVSYAVYLRKMVWFGDLAIFYPLPDRQPLGVVIACATLLLVVTVIVVLLWRRLPALAVGWFWFLGALVPMVGLVQVGSQALADRYTYLPCVGLLIMVMGSIPETFALAPSMRWARLALAVVVLALLVLFTRVQLSYWHDDLSLFGRALAVTENNDLAHVNMGVALTDRNRTDEAMAHFVDAVHINPNNAGGQYNLALALLRKGQPEQAAAHLERAIALSPRRSSYHNALGLALDAAGKPDAALASYAQAQTLDPLDAQPHFNRANTLARLGRRDEAIPEYEAALELNPRDADAHLNLSNLLSAAGQFDAALAHVQAALQLNPNHAPAHNNLGLLLARRGEMDAAIAQFRRSLELRPDYEPAKKNLARALGEE